MTIVLKFLIVVTNYGINFKPKIIVDEYDFKFLKIIKIVFTNYDFHDVIIKD